jgi:hypothetical protein
MKDGLTHGAEYIGTARTGAEMIAILARAARIAEQMRRSDAVNADAWIADQERQVANAVRGQADWGRQQWGDDNWDYGDWGMDEWSMDFDFGDFGMGAFGGFF